MKVAAERAPSSPTTIHELLLTDEVGECEGVKEAVAVEVAVIEEGGEGLAAEMVAGAEVVAVEDGVTVANERVAIDVKVFLKE